MKEKILNKATNMFLSFGFKSVTMDDLANVLGISKKTIYSHFNNKTKLVEECTLNLFNTISCGIDTICTLNKNPIEELYEIWKFAMIHLKNEKSSPQFQLQKYYPKIHNTLKLKQYDLMQECVVDNINRGLELGIYRENLNVDFVSKIYFAGNNSIKDQTLFPSDKFSMPNLIELFLEYHIRAIVTPKGRKILNKIINSNQD